MSPPALRLRGLVKRYRRGWLGRRDALPAVDGVDLDLGPGEVLALVGESGSGKTTLARCALGLLRPDEGSVELLGQALAGISRRDMEALRRRAQPLFQDPDAHLNPGLDVREILLESARLHRPGEPAAALVDQALEAVGLQHRDAALPHELSGGERRRVGIARLLLCRPALVVADEPTSGLDAARKAEVLDLLLSVGGPTRAALVISHDLALAGSRADRVAVMVSGRIVERLPAASLRAGPHHPYTAELLAAAGLGDPTQVPLTPGVAAGPGSPGCPLDGRCALASAACATTRPPERALASGHVVACHAFAEHGAEPGTGRLAPTGDDAPPTGPSLDRERRPHGLPPTTEPRR